MILRIISSGAGPLAMIGLAFLVGGAASASAGEVAAIKARVEAGQASCAAVIADRLDRIAARDQLLHSVIATDPTAIVRARRIDRLPAARKRRLPLLCAPLLVKDNIDVAGLPTTAGSVALAGNVARRDAAAVAALRRAGAVVVAKTNMSEFAFNYRGRSSIRGQTTSPFSVRESAGGSSSGNGAALAAGFGVLALGTDTSGSLRVPAALAGVVGLRPTFGTVPRDGVLPLSPSQDAVGPMCRAIDDCLAALRVLTRHRDGPSAEPLKGLRVGLLDHLFPAGPMRVAVDGAVARLSAAGAIVSPAALADEQVLTGAVPPPGHKASFASRSAFDFPDVMDRYLPSRTGVPADARALLAALRDGRTDPKVAADVARFIANRDGAAGDERHAVNGAFRDAFVEERIARAFSCAPGGDCLDLLLYPSVRDVAADAERGPDTGGTHRLAAYSGRPAIAFPIGAVRTAGGVRPVSVELMGRPGSDAMLLAIVGAWQARLDLPRAHDCADGEAAVCLADPD